VTKKSNETKKKEFHDQVVWVQEVKSTIKQHPNRVVNVPASESADRGVPFCVEWF
jgi:hypothetical protein